MFTRHLSATKKGISMHSDPNVDQLAFDVDGVPTLNESSTPSASTVTEPSIPPSSSASALDALLNEYRARATSEREKGTLFEELTRQFLLHDARFAHQFKEVYLARLRAQLEDLQNQREHPLTQDAKLIATISSQMQDLERLEVAVEQRGTLITQYDADVARLDLQLQDMRYDRTHPHPDTCQFYNSTFKTLQPSNEDIASGDSGRRLRLISTRCGISRLTWPSTSTETSRPIINC